jgi:AraC-like DNA-binding protein
VFELHSENALTAPSPALRGVIARYNGFSYRGSSGGVHQGLPSRYVTMVVSAGPPIVVDRSAWLEGDGAFFGLVAGLRSRPVAIRNQGEGSGVIVSLSPLGARRLFGGLPAGALAGRVVPLDELLGRAAIELQERVAEARTWPARFAALDETLHWLLTERVNPPVRVCGAWRRLVASGGQTRVDALATEVGWSRRHLERRFRDELGLGVKEAARVLRFERTVAALDQRPANGCAGLAAECGYFDQAHLANEWRRLAGVSVTEWLRQELRDPPPHLSIV